MSPPRGIPRTASNCEHVFRSVLCGACCVVVSHPLRSWEALGIIIKSPTRFHPRAVAPDQKPGVVTMCLRVRSG